MLEAGWAIDDLVRLDGLAEGRGLLSRVLTGSPAIRHTTFLVLSRRHHDRLAGAVTDEESDTALANALRRERARAIIEHVFGTAEDGLLGALARLGGEPLSSPGSYARLHALFRRVEDRHKGKALQHVGQITGKMLRVIDALDARWVHPETLTRIETMAEAIMFNRAVAFAQAVCSRATDEAIAGDIARLQPTSTLVGLVQRFVRRADRFPPHPIQGDSEVRPFNSVPDFLAASRAFRNCLSQKIEVALVGRAAFAEFRGGGDLGVASVVRRIRLDALGGARRAEHAGAFGHQAGSRSEVCIARYPPRRCRRGHGPPSSISSVRLPKALGMG